LDHGNTGRFARPVGYSRWYSMQLSLIFTPNMGDARIRCCALHRSQQRIRALGWLTAAHVGLPRRTVIDIAGMTIPLTLRRCWRCNLAVWGLSIGCLPNISGWLYPLLREVEGPKATSQIYGLFDGKLLTVLSGWLGAAALGIRSCYANLASPYCGEPQSADC
jgi:hypothetical protein